MEREEVLGGCFEGGLTSVLTLFLGRAFDPDPKEAGKPLLPTPCYSW